MENVKGKATEQHFAHIAHSANVEWFHMNVMFNVYLWNSCCFTLSCFLQAFVGFDVNVRKMETIQS